MSEPASYLEDEHQDQTMVDGEQWLTRREAAQVVGCSVSAIRKWEKSGVVRASTAEDGRTVTVWLADVRERYSSSARLEVRGSADAAAVIERLASHFAPMMADAGAAGELRGARERITYLEDELERVRDELEHERSRANEAREELATVRGILSARQLRRLNAT